MPTYTLLRNVWAWRGPKSQHQCFSCEKLKAAKVNTFKIN